MARRVFGAVAFEVEMEFHTGRAPAMHGALDHRRAARVVGPADLAAGGALDRGDGREIGFARRRRIGRDAVQQRDVGGAGAFQGIGCRHDLVQRRHARGKHDGFAGGGASFEQRRHQQFVRRDLVERDEGAQLRHGFEIERRARELNAALQAALGQRPQMRQRQFPLPAGPVLFALRQNLRREHAVDLEELEFHRVAAGLRRRVDERQRAAKIAVVIGRRLGDEDRCGRHVGVL